MYWERTAPVADNISQHHSAVARCRQAPFPRRDHMEEHAQLGDCQHRIKNGRLERLFATVTLLVLSVPCGEDKI
jgi:hypothetical protein